MRRDPLHPHVLRKFRDEAEAVALSNFSGRQLLADRGIAWDDPAAAWERMRPSDARRTLDDRIFGHWRERYLITCAEIKDGVRRAAKPAAS